MTSLSTCNLCSGTGKTLTRVPFPYGFGSARCFVCSGLGMTKSQASDQWVGDQARMRRMAKASAVKMEEVQ